MPAAPPTAGRSNVLAMPNVTPMIDVMLVLLIIFMLVTPVLSAGNVKLPQGLQALPRPEEVRDRTLTIDAAGTYTLNTVRVTKAELPVQLRQYVKDHLEDRVLYLRADQALEYGVVRDAMQVAAESGIVVVGMVTEVPAPTRSGQAMR
jgi:biopolymer transport protein TolR